MTVLLPRAGAPIIQSDGKPTTEHYQWCARITEEVNTAATPAAVEEAAPADPSLPLNTLALGLKSVEHYGSLADGQVSFALRGDVTAPGLNYVYGTDAAGVRGWRELASTTNLAEGTNLYHTAARVLATVLTGLSTATATVITAADSVLVMAGKLQAQISALITQTITNGDTTHAPSGDAVFDALAGKANGAGVTVSSGTYTPIVTLGANATGATAPAWQWLRVGNTVTASGRIDVACAAAGGTLTIVLVSLPVPSNLGSSSHLAGAGGMGYTPFAAALILADVAADKANLQFHCAATGSTAGLFTFTYQVI